MPRNPSPRLVDLNAFCRKYVRNLIDRKVKIDCADLAIVLWIRFAEEFNIPIQFRIWNTRHRRYSISKRRNYSNVDRYEKYIKNNLGALGLMDNTVKISGGHRNSYAGDVFLWEYRNAKTDKTHPYGHTQVVDEIMQNDSTPDNDTVRIVSGTLPIAVPRFDTKPAQYFKKPRKGVMLSVNDHQEAHTGLLYENGPRRFESFKHLT